MIGSTMDEPPQQECAGDHATRKRHKASPLPH